MSKIEIKLTKQEIFNAIHDYVEKHHPHIACENTSIFTQYNTVQYAVADCTYKKEDK